MLFISHSSKDNNQAIALRNWLRANGWGQVFLDLDPSQGLAPGQRWQSELKRAGEKCSGVLLLLSKNWIASRWCQTEFLLADQLGKRIFPILVEPLRSSEIPFEITLKYQFVDLSDEVKMEAGLLRLAAGLRRAGLAPTSFEWPPRSDPLRPIYPGLHALEIDDAAIFFGRDAMITKGLDALRRMRDGASERMLVVLGASGAGKSSFLKAGLLARLQRDEENFLVLPHIRPAPSPLSGDFGLARAVESHPRALSNSSELAAVISKLRQNAYDQLVSVSLSAGEEYALRPPTVVIAIDQAEEIFNIQSQEAAHVIELLSGLMEIDDQLIVIITIRSDSYAHLQNDQRMNGISRMLLDLPPIPISSFKDVIEQPARLSNPPIKIDPALTDQLISDLSAVDALPLLAFTLQRLAYGARRRGSLSLSDYLTEMGGLEGAIVAAVESAFESAKLDAEIPTSRLQLEELVRGIFIPGLVRLDDPASEPKCRVEKVSALPREGLGLVRHLVDQRILRADRQLIDGVAEDVVEVAHEAVLRHWPALSHIIGEERDALYTLESVRVSAAEWQAQGEIGDASPWLNHRGDRLSKAEALFARPDFTNNISNIERKYIVECRDLENSNNEKEMEKIRRARKLQFTIGFIIASFGIVVFIGLFFIISEAVSLRHLRSNTMAELAQIESGRGYYDRAARYAVLAVAGAETPIFGFRSDAADRELRRAVSESDALGVYRGHHAAVWSSSFSPNGAFAVSAGDDELAIVWDLRTGARKLVLHVPGGQVRRAAFDPTGRFFVTASEDGGARIWDAAGGRLLKSLRGHTGGLFDARYCSDGTKLVTASRDRSALIWDAETGHPLVRLIVHDGVVRAADFSPNCRFIATGSEDGTAAVWDSRTGIRLKVLEGHGDRVTGVAFSPDGSKILTTSRDHTARIWSVDNSDAPLAILVGHQDAVTSGQFSRDGSLVITSSRDHSIRFWDTKSGAQVLTLNGHDGVVREVSVSRDGSEVISASEDNSVRVWSTRRAASRSQRLRTQFLASQAVFEADLGRLVVPNIGGSTRVYSDGSPDSTTLEDGGRTATVVAISRNGLRVATASPDKHVRIWDASSGQPISDMPHNSTVSALGLSPDGTLILTASIDGAAHLWATDGRRVADLTGGASKVVSVAFAASGKWAATGYINGRVRIWSPSGALVQEMNGESSPVVRIEFSPGADKIAVVHSAGLVNLWSLTDKKLLTTLGGFRSNPPLVAFDLSGQKLLTMATDAPGRVWNTLTGHEEASLQGPNAIVANGVFDKTGTRIISSSLGEGVNIWDAQDGRELASIPVPGIQVWNVGLRAGDGKIVASGMSESDQNWRVMTVKPSSLAAILDLACRTTLKHGLNEISPEDLQRAPVVNPRDDADVCRRNSLLDVLHRVVSTVSRDRG